MKNIKIPVAENYELIYWVVYNSKNGGNNTETRFEKK